MRAKQSVEGRPYAPFLSMCANCLLWTTYGLLFRDPTIIMTNGVGLALSLYYIYAYFSAAKLAEREPLTQHAIWGGAGVLGAVIFILTFSSNPKLHMGILGGLAATIMFASPLMQIWTVMRTRSTRTMSFPLSSMSCLVTLSWSAYGLHVADNFVFYPNAVGFILACAQLSLFALYPSSSTIIVDLGSHV
jgi:solute carrier family 50 protein (sugar transporter)